MVNNMTPEEIGKLVEKALELKFEKDFELQLSKHPVEEEILYDDGHERHVKYMVVGANHGYLEVGHNGKRGGDAGHGGYTNLTLSFESDLQVILHKGEQDFLEFPDGKLALPIFNDACVELTVKGDDERRVLIQMLKCAINELEKNQYLNGK